jgi:hypothetical protein
MCCFSFFEAIVAWIADQETDAMPARAREPSGFSAFLAMFTLIASANSPTSVATSASDDQGLLLVMAFLRCARLLRLLFFLLAELSKSDE